MGLGARVAYFVQGEQPPEASKLDLKERIAFI